MTIRRGGILFLLFAALTVFLALRQLQPPAPLPRTVSDSLFSAERAMIFVQTLAAAPRPVGSESHQRVQKYLVEELESLGLTPRIHTVTSTLTFGYARAARVSNIVAVIKGTANTSGILIVAHYDSAPVSPGASDDAMGVAVILECLRSLRPALPLRNDLIILLSDAEELGLLGAKAFVEDSSLVSGIGIAINFEARGTGGPSIMFETNEENGWIIGRYAEAASRKVASSLTYDLYKRLPNNTDFTIFKRAGMSGLNFANIGDVAWYHSSHDRADRLDRGTLQHHGSQLLSLIRSLGGLNLSNTRAPDVVYFSFLLPRFVLYPVSLVKLFAVVATLLFGALILIGLVQSQLKVTRVLLSFFIFVLRMALAAAAAHFLWKWLGPLHPEFGTLYLHTIFQGGWYFVAFVGLGFAIATMFHRPLALRLSSENLAAGGLSAWLVLTWVVSLEAPGASYLFVWPMIFTQAALIVWWRTGITERIVKPAFAALIVGAIPGMYLFTQVLVLLYDGMTLFLAGALGALVVLLVGTLQPHLDLLSTRRSWHLPAAGLALFIFCAGWALTNRGFSEEHPKPNTMLYLYDADSAKADWASWDAKPDEWTGQFLGREPDTMSLSKFIITTTARFLTSPAKAMLLKPPSLDVVSDVTRDTVRILTMSIQSRRGASGLFLMADPLDEILESSVNGKPITSSVAPAFFVAPNRWAVEYAGPSGEPLQVQIAVRAGKLVHLTVVDSSPGFPETLSSGITERPGWMMPNPYLLTDVTLVSTRVDVGRK